MWIQCGDSRALLFGFGKSTGTSWMLPSLEDAVIAYSMSHSSFSLLVGMDLSWAHIMCLRCDIIAGTCV